jgi:CBS domain containing-hemolysin-like protein
MVEVERDKFDTVGGLIAHLTGRIPATGEEVIGAGLVLHVLDADGRRIGKVKVTRHESTGEAAAE